jgi:peroxiredoxin
MRSACVSAACTCACAATLVRRPTPCDRWHVNHDPLQLPADLPRPIDDGAADHLRGRRLPAVGILATDGTMVDLSAVSSAWTVVYIYPRTGVPGVDPPSGWDDIPGARGCTPQSCSFRDVHAELADLGTTVFGLSTQSHDEQMAFARRQHLPFLLLSDPEQVMGEALRLPTFEADGIVAYKRMTVIVREGIIVHVRYPVFPPDRDADEVLAWLRNAAGAD